MPPECGRIRIESKYHNIRYHDIRTTMATTPPLRVVLIFQMLLVVAVRGVRRWRMSPLLEQQQQGFEGHH